MRRFLAPVSALVLMGCPFFTAPAEDSPAPAPSQPSPTTVRIEPQAPAAPRPTPAPAPAPTPTPTPGETVAARHILIQYSGSTRAGAGITRTKDEAERVAGDVARQAQADGADFEALAREFSDGPTGPRGGDLGEFPRGRMHPAFEQAAFALGVGDVSGIVETPFGFHIIQRYR